VFWGYVAMMEGLISRLRDEIGRPVKVVATGGLAVLFEGGRATIFDHVDTDLTLDGIAVLAERVSAEVIDPGRGCPQANWNPCETR